MFPLSCARQPDAKGPRPEALKQKEKEGKEPDAFDKINALSLVRLEVSRSPRFERMATAPISLDLGWCVERNGGFHALFLRRPRSFHISCLSMSERPKKRNFEVSTFLLFMGALVRTAPHALGRGAVRMSSCCGGLSADRVRQSDADRIWPCP